MNQLEYMKLMPFPIADLDPDSLMMEPELLWHTKEDDDAKKT